MTWSGSGTLSADHLAIALGLPIPTAQQRRVIEAPAAPALVVAGAGSGKTETMAGRVVWLVANGHVRREEVLGLTFTRKAAGELAERINRRLARVDEYAGFGLLPHLSMLVSDGHVTSLPVNPGQRRQVLQRLAEGFQTESAGGDDPLLRPRVSTYNAFADALAREHAALIGRDPEAQLLSPSASWLLAREQVITSDDPELEERDYALQTVIEAVNSLAGSALDHRADLQEVAHFGATFASELEPFVNFDLASPGPVERAWGAASGLGMVSGLVQRHAQAKVRRGVIDYADQVASALEIVRTRPEVGKSVREQYRVVLLDEYQDTSVIQTELLAEVFRRAPVMAVGDPNQSIYAWRGASADNLSAFSGAFGASEESRYDLSISWRNDRQVLEAANALLADTGQDASLGHLEARPGAGAGRVERLFEETIEAEADGVAEWFEKLRADVVRAGGDVHEHSGAILFRAKKHMQTFADALDRRGIPHRILGLGGLLSTPEVTDVVAALRVINDPSQGSALLRLLAGPRFAVGVADLAALADLARILSESNSNLSRLDADLLRRIRGSAGADVQVSIIDALDFLRGASPSLRMLSAFTDEGRSRLAEAAEMFARLRAASAPSIPDLIREIERELLLDVELAANESRGPASVSSTQLRAFTDEVRGFLGASDRGSIAALLAWLEHAEGTDELMPRPEPPQPGVVQLLTIHGAKGLEWDAVAVVRMVDEEFPKRSRSSSGWLTLGGLPYQFRGDRAALPQLDLVVTTETTKRLVTKAIEDFRRGVAHQARGEERRLAYVAVTRARSNLMLTGSWWGGQKNERQPSLFLEEIVAACGLDPLPDQKVTANPYASAGRIRRWPLDPLGTRGDVVRAAAAAVRDAPIPPARGEIARLLTERAERASGEALEAPTRISASRFKDYVRDFSATVRSINRPMPERPYRRNRIGTLFHAWVERRSGLVGGTSDPLSADWERDDEDAPGMVPAVHARELEVLKSHFERSEWSGLQPLAVELEIDLPLLTGEESERIIICKLDAVYERDGRIEIVDWKTGRPPVSVVEREESFLQLALYRLAYHRRFGVPLERIDVALFYVSDEIVLRAAATYSEPELVQRFNAARAARSASGS